jgi:hypothetical protein
LVGKQPYDQVAGLIDKIRGQAFAQQQQEQAAAAVPAAGQQYPGAEEHY